MHVSDKGSVWLGSRLGLMMVLVLTACTSTDTITPPPPPPPPPDGSRPIDPGLSYAPDCLGSIPVPNTIQAGGQPESIPALVDPAFLTVDEVGFLLPDDYVFGLEIQGLFFAFPVRILNYHESATFTVGSSRYAATWCPLSFSTVALRNSRWENAQNGRSASFKISGALMDNNLVLFDVETRTTWPQVLAMGNSGPLQGVCLDYMRNVTATTYEFWKTLHPDTWVLTNQNGDRTSIKPDRYGFNPYEDYHALRSPLLWPVLHPDSRLPERDIVFGVHGKNGSAVIRTDRALATTTIGESPVVLFQDTASKTLFAFENNLFGVVRTFEAAPADENGLPQFRDLESGTLWSIDGVGRDGEHAGERLAQMPSLQAYWFVWGTFFPGVPILRL